MTTSHVSSARPWVRKGDTTHCERHGTDFVLPATCTQCDADPGSPVDDEIDAPLPKPPAGCKSPVQIERWFVSLAEAAQRSAAAVGLTTTFDASKNRKTKTRRELDFHDHSAIAKHRDNALKFMRAATELALRRDDNALVVAREKRIRDRQRGASH